MKTSNLPNVAKKRPIVYLSKGMNETFHSQAKRAQTPEKSITPTKDTNKKNLQPLPIPL